LKETLETTRPQQWRQVRDKLYGVVAIIKTAIKQLAILQKTNAEQAQTITYSKMRLDNWRLFVDDLLEAHAENEISIEQFRESLMIGPCNKIRKCPECGSLGIDPDDARLECPHCEIDMETVDE